MKHRRGQSLAAFTLVELLVVVSIIGLLLAILMPALKKARFQARSTVCLSQLHVLGQGLGMYALDHDDAMLPGRMPKTSDGDWVNHVAGGRKYRPTFLAMMGSYVGVPAFDDPQDTKAGVDRFGEAGGRQDYSSDIYVCPSVSHWTDERNGSYGYNYQFLGNSRLSDENDGTSFKNWPVKMTSVACPGRCVAVADCMGTAASFTHRQPYDNNARDDERYGNEAFNLDPPRVDTANGEMAAFDHSPQVRTAVHDRHLGRASVLWLDAHCDSLTPLKLGYAVDAEGVFGFEGNNRFFAADGQDKAWLQSGT